MFLMVLLVGGGVEGWEEGGFDGVGVEGDVVVC